MIYLILIALCFGIIEMIKIFTTEKINNFIPVFALITGVIISTACYITSRELLPEQITFFENLIAGILCGLSATGLHQLLINLHKHLTNKKQKLNKKEDKVITLKDVNYEKLCNQNTNDNNKQTIPNNKNSLCNNCPYFAPDEPELVNKKIFTE